MSPAERASPAETDEMNKSFFAKRGCCSWIPCVGRSERASSAVGSSWWERIRTAEMNDDDKWWVRSWRNFREWSEIVAGPKWKTFIRRFNKNRFNRTKFQYDPLSYALNFDEGPGQNGHLDEDYLGRDFSCRFASIPASAKSSMDFGKDAPVFT